MRFYRALLRLYPSSFRNEYGEEMHAAFAARRPFWLVALLEVVWNAAAVHWDLFRQDARYTLRTWRRAPGFVIAAVVVAALGIGATTAVFSLADHVLLRPLPYPDPERLVTVWESVPGYTRMEPSPANFRDWQRMASSFEDMAAYTGGSVNMLDAGEPERVEYMLVSGRFMEVLRARPLIGRMLTEEDDRPDAKPVVVLSYGLWRAKFGADPGVLGREIRLNILAHTVVGVMPPEFRFPTRETQVWRALRMPESSYATDRNNNMLNVVARLRPGVSLGQARAEMNVVAAQLERQYPKENLRHGVTTIAIRDELSSGDRTLLGALAGAGLCVLLIACSNLANLLLARALSRRKELAVRTAMGAGRERLVRQLATENLLLAAMGGALGVGLAFAGLPLLASLVPNSLPIAAAPGLDLRLLAFAAILTGLTGGVFGVVPSLRVCGRIDALQDSARSGGGRKERLRGALVILEVTVSVVLLVSSGLLLRALGKVRGADPGFTAEKVYTLRTPIGPAYTTEAQRHAFYERVLSSVRQLPGVSNAAYVSGLPMVMRGGIWNVSLTAPDNSRAITPSAHLRFVTPGFFDTLRIPLRAGRDIGDGDTAARGQVAVVSESFVRLFFPGQDPIGQRFYVGLFRPAIVGVVGDVRMRGLERTNEPQVYLPARLMPDRAAGFYVPKDLVIRTQGAPGLVAAGARQAVHAADPVMPVWDARPLTDVVDADVAPRSVQASVIALLAGMAFLLAAVGIHGVLAFAVAQRTQEIGVRVALGAQPGAILGLVAGQGALLAAAGLVPGIALAWVAARAMQSLLAGVSPRDPETYAVAAVLTAMMTIAGSLLPAVRALRVDPMRAMRTE